MNVFKCNSGIKNLSKFFQQPKKKRFKESQGFQILYLKISRQNEILRRESIFDPVKSILFLLIKNDDHVNHYYSILNQFCPRIWIAANMWSSFSNICDICIGK